MAKEKLAKERRATDMATEEQRKERGEADKDMVDA
jgi:hypothetical protein